VKRGKTPLKVENGKTDSIKEDRNDKLFSKEKENVIYCANCGTQLSLENKFCVSCGTKIE
jgi:hypothetical protein